MITRSDAVSQLERVVELQQIARNSECKATAVTMLAKIFGGSIAKSDVDYLSIIYWKEYYEYEFSFKYDGFYFRIEHGKTCDHDGYSITELFVLTKKKSKWKSIDDAETLLGMVNRGEV
jgi:hypothetical protein